MSVEIAIAELGEAVKDLLEEVDPVKQDLILLRWLKYAKMDVKKAEKYFRETMQWRKEKKVDQLVQVYRNSSTEMREMVPMRIGTQKSGIPYSISYAGKTMLKDAIDRFGKEEVYNYLMGAIEMADQMIMDLNLEELEKVGHIGEYSFIGGMLLTDYKGISLRQMMPLRALQINIQVNSDALRHYPLLATTWVAVNCSRLTVPLINVIRKMITDEVQIHVFDTDQTKFERHLKNIIDDDKLPTTLGGSLVIPEFL